MFDRKTTKESPRTPRVRRRHTATGTGGLTLQDIEVCALKKLWRRFCKIFEADQEKMQVSSSRVFLD